jgi:hypothetical protein
LAKNPPLDKKKAGLLPGLLDSVGHAYFSNK